MTSIRLPYPHPGQQIIQQQARRFNWLAAGRRWRKTTLVMSIAVEEAATRGKTIVWGAPTYDQVRVGWEETRRACRGAANFNETRMHARFPNGGQILYRSLDNPDNARGHTADGVVIDEIQDVHPDAWYEVLRPMLLDTGGWMWGVGTPKGQNWVYVEHNRAADRTDSRAWQVPTLGVRITDHGLEREPHPLENPNVAFSEIEQLYESLPQATFQQEILGIFLQNEGAVFRNITANLTAPLDATPAAHAGHRTVMGVDWAQVHDYTALSVLCVPCRCEVALDRFNQVEWAVQRDRLSTLAARWAVQSVLAELNSIGSPNVEALQRAGLPVRGFATTASSKPPLIQALALALEREDYRWLDIPVATAELAAYEVTVTPQTGAARYSAPPGLHDDTVITRALALRAATTDAGLVDPAAQQQLEDW